MGVHARSPFVARCSPKDTEGPSAGSVPSAPSGADGTALLQTARLPSIDHVSLELDARSRPSSFDDGHIASRGRPPPNFGGWTSDRARPGLRRDFRARVRPATGLDPCPLWSEDDPRSPHFSEKTRKRSSKASLSAWPLPCTLLRSLEHETHIQNGE